MKTISRDQFEQLFVLLMGTVLVGIIFVMLLSCGGQTHRQSNLNPYVDGPLIVAEAKELAADLLNAHAISSDDGKAVRLYGDSVTAGLAAAKAAGAIGDLSTEQSQLNAVIATLRILQTFNATRSLK